jgi:hypothetical protein
VHAGNVIVVTVNYRLMMFGFMASPELKAEDPNGSTGNYGMQDQRLAMQVSIPLYCHSTIEFTSALCLDISPACLIGSLVTSRVLPSVSCVQLPVVYIKVCF